MGKKADRVQERFNEFRSEIANLCGRPYEEDVDFLIHRVGEMRDQALRGAAANVDGTDVGNRLESLRSALASEKERSMELCKALYRAAYEVECFGDPPKGWGGAFEALDVVQRRLAGKVAEYRGLCDRFDQQVRQWAPFMKVLGVQGHESALMAAERVVREREELAAELTRVKDELNRWAPPSLEDRVDLGQPAAPSREP